ncbi:unnamed protein product [Ambrosiozyma monospora]|uniref:Unnamed protein product n=1 Tax=Ambrosiozyma monospora TaxID=43982 RepID=A0A9W6YRB2_AMBMO|nr:unnamed protein product [Ambrosiozyma monospora]
MQFSTSVLFFVASSMAYVTEVYETKTEQSTTLATITSCGPEVTNCPYRDVTSTTSTPVVQASQPPVVCNGENCPPSAAGTTATPATPCNGENCPPSAADCRYYHSSYSSSTTTPCNGKNCPPSATTPVTPPAAGTTTPAQPTTPTTPCNGENCPPSAGTTTPATPAQPTTLVTKPVTSTTPAVPCNGANCPAAGASSKPTTTATPACNGANCPSTGKNGTEISSVSVSVYEGAAVVNGVNFMAGAFGLAVGALLL